MKRRDFFKQSIPAAAVFPALLNGYSVKAFNQENPLVKALQEGQTETDHVLVLVQLSGGNDGLNTVIPLSNYNLYQAARSNVAIEQSKVLALNGYNQTGLHPAMTHMRTMYNEGKMAIVQAVGYPTPNFSHFRATDIWMSASNSTQEVYTGWAGRYLNYEYPNFPTGYPNTNMPDPLAIQIGSSSSLTFQGPATNMGMSITNPTNFYNLINGVQDPVPNTYAGKELSYIRLVAQQTQQYATVIKNAANAVTVQGAYPSNNSLADQLKIVARLIKGGLKTRVYMVSIGGFDTHSVQVNASDTSTGTHANLLGRVSAAIKAFQDDCQGLGIAERVVGMTFSEFGRRIRSNSSVGTDHGSAAPLFLFGNAIKSGVLGNTPSIPNSPAVNDSVPMQYDFRSIYSTILKNWFCLNDSTVNALFPPNVNATLQNLPLFKNGCSSVAPPPSTSGETLITNYPNPFVHSTRITFRTEGGHTLIQIMDMLGRVVAVPVNKEYPAATSDVTTFNCEGLPAGMYYARLQNGATQVVRPMVKVKD
jgi:uncharacterized protein (DUF1501 family)